MTAILASRHGWMVADTAVECSIIKIPAKVNKIVRWECALAACAGPGIVADRLAAIQQFDPDSSNCRKEQQISEMLQKHPGNDAQVVLVQNDTLYDIDGKGAVTVIADDYWAGGTGIEYLLGFVDSMLRAGLTPTICDGIDAIERCSKRIKGVTAACTWDLVDDKKRIGNERFASYWCGRHGCSHCKDLHALQYPELTRTPTGSRRS